MTRLIDPSLKSLSLAMGEMGEMAIKTMSLAMESFVSGTNTKEETRRISKMMTHKYFEVEELTFGALLKYQPVARDFRFIRSSIEISYAFLRFGRYAYDITLIRDSFGDISRCKNDQLMDSFVLVERMIKEAVLSFASLDTRKAKYIQDREAMTDTIYKERMSVLIQSSDTKCALAEALLLRYLERIADHALFMSDAIAYIVTGRHNRRPPQIHMDRV